MAPAANPFDSLTWEVLNDSNKLLGWLSENWEITAAVWGVINIGFFILLAQLHLCKKKRSRRVVEESSAEAEEAARKAVIKSIKACKAGKHA